MRVPTQLLLVNHNSASFFIRGGKEKGEGGKKRRGGEEMPREPRGKAGRLSDLVVGSSLMPEKKKGEKTEKEGGIKRSKISSKQFLVRAATSAWLTRPRSSLLSFHYCEGEKREEGEREKVRDSRKYGITNKCPSNCAIF